MTTERTRFVSQEAAYWFIRFTDEPKMGPEDKKLLADWVRRSPENVAEVLRIAGLDDQARQGLLQAVKEAEESNVFDIGSRGNVSQYEYDPSDSVPDTVKRKLPAPWAFAAMVAGLAVALLFGFGMFSNSPNRAVATAASQWQHMSLEDGSTVHMDARTRLKVEFSGNRRLVHLYEGRAVFEVAKDKKRPFTVRTHIVDVTAVGTRFQVAISPGVTTTVSEGVVRVTPLGRLDDVTTMKLLYAGDELNVMNSTAGKEDRVFGGGGGYVDLSKLEELKVDAEHKLEWANGWLTFQAGERIGDMVAEFNRRNTLQIKLDNESIADRRLAGYYRFRVDSPESFLHALDSQGGITVIRNGTNVVRVKSD